jgi:hypothetical protein
MNRSNRLLAGLIVPLFLISAAANAAALVIEQPLLEAVPPLAVESALDDQGIGVESADNFATTVPFSLETISWWGSYDDFGLPIDDPGLAPTDDRFNVRIFSDAGGLPGGLVASYDSVVPNRVPTTVFDALGALVFEYSYALPAPLPLGSGDYWLSVVNLATGFFSPVWLWAEADSFVSGDGRSAFREVVLVPDPWVEDPFIDLAYRLEGTIPVVPPLLLMAAPVLLLIARRRR